MRLLHVMVGILFAVALFMGVGLAAGGIQEFGTKEGAIMLMAGGLVAAWILVGGAIFYFGRERAKRLVQSLPGGWALKFILLGTTLVLIEEAITTTLTNLAPLFGATAGEVFITASPNYLETILYHSAIVIVPMIFAWAWLLRRFTISAPAAFLIFGITGIVAELFVGGAALGLAPMWIFIYGLMIFWPVYTLPERSGAVEPRWYQYLLFLIVPLLAAAVVAFIVVSLSPYLPHFGPTFSVE